MYFGAKTKAAVMSFQMSRPGLGADGVVGPRTGAAIAALGGGSTSTGNLPAGCTSTAGFSPVTGQPCNGGSTNPSTPTALNGTDGSIADVSKLSQYNNEEVGEGKSDVIVAGFEVEATNDGDIALRSVKVVFDSTGNTTQSDNLDDYIDEVSIWMGSNKIGSADVDGFNEDSSGKYSRTITLNNPVVKADKIEKFYIAVDAVKNLDSGDITGDSWSVGISNIRFVDGSGVVTTDTESFTTGSGQIGWDSSGDGIDINFVDYGTAADTELKISKDSSSPSSQVVMVDEDDNTDNVLLLKGKMKLEGTSDVTVDELPITLTTVGGANVAAVANSLTLKIGGEEYTETVSITGATSGTVTFDNLDFDISAGDTVNFEILADINDIDAGNFDEGDTLTASLTSTNRDYIDAENEEGDQLSDSSEKSGTATGSSMEFRSEGISASFVSQSTSVTTGQSANDDLGTFKIQFKVTAVGDTIYMSSLAGTSGAASNLFVVDRSGTTTTGGVSGTLTMININSSSEDDLTAAGNYTIEDGETRTFELVATVQLPTAGSAGQFKAALSTLKWNTNNSTTYQSYTQNLDSFKTSYVGLN